MDECKSDDRHVLAYTLYYESRVYLGEKAPRQKAFYFKELYKSGSVNAKSYYNEIDIYLRNKKIDKIVQCVKKR